jgi:hypothetical protein
MTRAGRLFRSVPQVRVREAIEKRYALHGPAFWKYGASSRMMRGHDGDRSEVVGASRRLAFEQPARKPFYLVSGGS